MNLKKTKKRYKGEFGGWEGKEELYNYIIISRIKEKLKNRRDFLLLPIRFIRGNERMELEITRKTLGWPLPLAGYKYGLSLQN